MSQRQSLKSSSMRISKFNRIPPRTPIAKTWRVQPLATTRMVRNVIANSTETKFLDGNYSNAGGNTGIITTFALPAQGAGDSNRVGDDIKPIGLFLRGYLSGGNVHVMRVIIFQWLIESTTAPTYGTVLNSTYSGTSLTAPFAFPAWDFQKKTFKILSDKTLYAGTSTGDIANVNYMVNIPASKLRKIHFVNGSTTDCFGGLYALCVQDGTVTLNSINFDSRLTYKDA